MGMQNEIFFSLRNTHGRLQEIRVPMPSTPALAGVDRVQLWIYGLSDQPQTLGLTIEGFEFLPPLTRANRRRQFGICGGPCSSRISMLVFFWHQMVASRF